MRLKVYQVNEDLDRHRTKFRDYDGVLEEAGRVDPSIYKTVFDGEVFRSVTLSKYATARKETPIPDSTSATRSGISRLPSLIQRRPNRSTERKWLSSNLINRHMKRW